MIFPATTEYSLGFYFNKSRTEVILVGKTKPPWQAGKWNGVGGHIEKNKLDESEGPWACMLREFKEETGITTDINNWRLKTTMGGRDWKCYVFAGFHDSDIFPPMRDFRKGEEIALAFSVEKILHDKEYRDTVIPNLHWLIPLCLDDQVVTAQATYY